MVEQKEQWSRNMILHLIETYRSHECLWNPKNVWYSDRIRRNNAWKQMASAVGYDIRSVEKKVKTLKTQFMHCYKRSKKYTGGNGEPPCQPKWFAYDMMKFLLPGKIYRDRREYLKRKQEEECDIDHNELMNKQDTVVVDKESDCISSVAETCVEMSPQSEAVNTLSQNSIPSRKLNSKMTNLAYEARRSVTNISEENGTEELSAVPRLIPQTEAQVRHECDIFGEYVACRLRNITNPRARILAQYHIMRILYEAELGNLPPPAPTFANYSFANGSRTRISTNVESEFSLKEENESESD